LLLEREAGALARRVDCAFLAELVAKHNGLNWGGGDTLYDFVPDTPTHSACLNDGCVFDWPPLVANGTVRVGQGVDRALVGTLRRPDGSTQLSYGGHPLYTYNGDVSPGVVMGQAIDQDGGLWYVLDAKGQQITTSFTVTSGNSNGNPNGNAGG